MKFKICLNVSQFIQLKSIQQIKTMNFFKKIFSSKEDPESVKNRKQKTSFLRWLCATKSQNQYDNPYGTGLKVLGQQASGNKSTISAAQTSNTKIIQHLSFGMDRGQFNAQQQVKGNLITIVESRINRIQDIVQEDGIYAMINSDQLLLGVEDNGIWLKIGRNQQINSLSHVRPYYFDKIFMILDQFGGQYSIEEILKCKQNIHLKLYHKTSAQSFIDAYEKQLIKHFAFRLMTQCFNKLKITIIRTRRNQVWLRLNQYAFPDVYLNEILQQIGFDETYEEYESLKQQIRKKLTLRQYIDITQHKQKLESKYEGQSVTEYIKNQFLQKISSKAVIPRIDSPRTAQQQSKKDHSQGYDDYILSMTTNKLPRERMQEQRSGNYVDKMQYNYKKSYEQDIFDFNVYKDQKQQQAKRLAINKERKKRSKSEDIGFNELHKDPESDGDYFDQKQ